MRRLPSLILILLTGLVLSAQSPHGEGLTISCDDCHTTNGWKMQEGTYTFRHDTTGFALTGQHASLDCRACHGTLVFSEAQDACVSCHTDLHQQTVGEDCALCHTTGSWLVSNIIQIHQMSRFPLLGAHRTADCYACHPSASTLNFQPQGVECIDCHETDYLNATNPNHVDGQFSTNCTDCHNMNVFSWTGAGIDHSFFPLTGGHAIGDCFACHTQGTSYSDLSTECFSCHESDYLQTINPNHAAIGLSTNCLDCHTTAPGWTPATFTIHDTQFFPIYSGEHKGEWNSCTDCHPDPSNYSLFTCTSCHEHNQSEMDDEHGDVTGYVYESTACYACHPTGTGEGSFNHNLTAFPLTGVHLETNCDQCHTQGYTGTPTECLACHEPDFNQSVNPSHTTLGISTDCQQCHTTQPDWKPAEFPVHDDYYALTGAHGRIATDCFACHEGNYTNTDNQCLSCHAADYEGTTDPNHTAAQFSTVCETCHTTEAWQPASFDHDAQYFPIYSGKHQGEWNNCADCHNDPSNYAIFTCIDCHEHNQVDMDDEHQGITGYAWASDACLACHPTGDAEGAFDHNTTQFPLTGAHTTVECSQCHTSGYTGTSTYCFDCHETAFNQTSNPNHQGISLSTDCAECHSTQPGWQPALFPVHDQYYVLEGAHALIANQCADCHGGNYVTTQNTCFGCHEQDYNQTTDPPHLSAQFPVECVQCHSQTAWSPSTFNHDSQYFPIYSGDHRNEWSSCSECHTDPSNYALFSCIDCHEHNQTSMDSEHQGVSGYQYNSEACFSCHPNGKSLLHMNRKLN